MDAAELQKSSQPAALAGLGELVLQNSRQAGTRRPLGMPTTFIGRDPGCDIRLNVEGVDPLHCVLVPGPDGVHLRDLNSTQGTWVNAERVETSVLRHGDALKIGPFHFRVELPAGTLRPESFDTAPGGDEIRESLRIQASAVAAQQIALEEEEIRLQKRRADLAQQEEQLAAHLAEKQRQIQLWSDYTKAERETLGKERCEQEKKFQKLEQEILHARQELALAQQKNAEERQRIAAVYQRLLGRWKKQSAAQREKHRKAAARLQAEMDACHESKDLLRVQEAALEQEILRFNTDREVQVRELREARAALKGDQERWRRRRSLEMQAMKNKTREAEDAQGKLNHARQTMLAQKDAWEKQLEALSAELHGLNHRVMNQRARIDEYNAEIARVEQTLRDRRAAADATDTIPFAVAGSDEQVIECDVEVVSEPSEAPAGQPVAAAEFVHVESLIGELADQRLHLVEQFARLGEIQTAWLQERDRACAELDSLAQRLLTAEQSLGQRHERADLIEGDLRRRKQEGEDIRQEILIARAQLQARTDAFADERRRQLTELTEKETLLQRQLDSLTEIRQKWNRRRQQEIEELRATRARAAQLQHETQERRLEIFEKGQQLEAEKRILAEKALALEQYRQEIFFRAQDPTAQKRVERLRRRWLTVHGELVRHAKQEREQVRAELATLEEQRTEMLRKLNELTAGDAELTQKQALLDERDAKLKLRQTKLDEDLARLETHRRQNEEIQLRLQDDVDTMAQVVYDMPDADASDKAA